MLRLATISCSRKARAASPSSVQRSSRSDHKRQDPSLNLSAVLQQPVEAGDQLLLLLLVLLQKPGFEGVQSLLQRVLKLLRQLRADGLEASLKLGGEGAE